MKTRHFILAGLAVSLVLVQCTNRESDPAAAARAAGQPFELFATSSTSRTVNDGLSTRWEAGDQIGVAHGLGAGVYISDGAFTIDDVSTGHAKGTVHPLQEGAYDWYVQYPFDESFTPSQLSALFGAEAGTAQQQAGYGSTAHLAGVGFPLFGSVKGVDFQSVPSVHVDPLAAAVSITVTNTLDEPVVITEATLTAPEPVTGLFLCDLSGETPVFAPESETQVSASATVAVSGGTALAKGESAVLYLGLKPFTAAAGSALTLSVTATHGSGQTATQSKTVTLPAAAAFRAAYIRGLSFSFAGEFAEPGEYVFAKTVEFAVGKRYLMVVPDGDGYRMATSRKGTETQLATVPVTVENDLIKLTSLEDAFLFCPVEANGVVYDGYYSIRQDDGVFVGVHTNSAQTVLAFNTVATTNAFWWQPSDDDPTVLVARTKTKILCYFQDTQVIGAASAAKESGIHPEFFCLQNEEESTEALLEETEYGAYGLPDWLYTAGTMQLSQYRTGETSSFRLLLPGEKTITQMSGIPATLSLEDEFTLHVLRYENGKKKLDKDFMVRVIKLEADKAWLLSPTGAGFIVKF